MSGIRVGDIAPDFTLMSAEKKEVALSSFRGKENVVLLFFPLAFTQLCTDELCSIRQDFSVYEDAHARVFGISADSVFTLEAYQKHDNIPCPLLSDYNREVSRAYGCLHENFPKFGMKQVPKRAAFVINKKGEVVYAEVKEVPSEFPDFAAIKNVLKGLV